MHNAPAVRRILVEPGFNLSTALGGRAGPLGQQTEALDGALGHDVGLERGLERHRQPRLVRAGGRRRVDGRLGPKDGVGCPGLVVLWNHGCNLQGRVVRGLLGKLGAQKGHVGVPDGRDPPRLRNVALLEHLDHEVVNLEINLVVEEHRATARLPGRLGRHLEQGRIKARRELGDDAVGILRHILSLERALDAGILVPGKQQQKDERLTSRRHVLEEKRGPGLAAQVDQRLPAKGVTHVGHGARVERRGQRRLGRAAVIVPLQLARRVVRDLPNEVAGPAEVHTLSKLLRGPLQHQWDGSGHFECTDVRRPAKTRLAEAGVGRALGVDVAVPRGAAHSGRVLLQVLLVPAEQRVEVRRLGEVERLL